MSSTHTSAGFVVAALAFFANACSDSHGEAGTNAVDLEDPRDLGVTQDAYCTGHAIVNVVIAPGTYHWEDPLHLLNSAEGFGPRTLSIAIADSISPSFSESSTYTPTDSEISTSVGYDLRVWPAFAVQPLLLSQGARPPPGAGSKFRHLHPRFRGPDPETTSRVTE